MSSEIEAVKAGLEEWEAGYRIVAAALNAFAEEKGLEPRIEADPPEHGLTLEECRRRLCDAMSTVKSKLRFYDDSVRCPKWIVGNVGVTFIEFTSTDDPPTCLRGDGVRDLDGTLSRAVDVLYSLFQYGALSNIKWRKHIVEPIETRARTVRENFAYFEGELRPGSDVEDDNEPISKLGATSLTDGPIPGKRKLVAVDGETFQILGRQWDLLTELWGDVDAGISYQRLGEEIWKGTVEGPTPRGTIVATQTKLNAALMKIGLRYEAVTDDWRMYLRPLES